MEAKVELITSLHCAGLQVLEVFDHFHFEADDDKNDPVRLCIKVGRGKGDGDFGTRVWGLGSWGRETRDLRTSNMGRGDVKYRDAGHAGYELLLQKSEVNAISVTFLVNMFWRRQPTLPSLGILQAFLRSEDSAKTLCIEERKTVVLVFLLMEYWSPKQGRAGCGRQDLCTITAFDSK